MTKTEAQIISAAAGNGIVFLGKREKTTLLSLMATLRVLKAKHHSGNCVVVLFDGKLYMGTEPDEYLTESQIKSHY